MIPLSPAYTLFWIGMIFPFFVMFFVLSVQFVILLRAMKEERKLLKKVLVEMLVLYRLIRP